MVDHKEEKEENTSTDSGHQSKEALSTISDPEKATGEDGKPFVKSPEERAFFRKLNWTLLPLVGMTILVQFCDKAAISVAPVMGLFDEIPLPGMQFSWVGAIFYLGYLVYQIPNNFILQRVPHGRYLAVLLVLWGVVMALTSLCHNFSQLAAMRFLLGLFEAAAMPCLYIITATLYRRSEQPFIFGFILFCTGAGAAVGSAIAYGIAHMNNAHGIADWRWGHIIFGVLTIAIGIVSFFCLVDRPDSPILRLTEKEKEIIIERTKDNAVVQHKEFKYFQIVEALKEVRFWAVVLSGLLINFHSGGMVVFSATFVNGLGFTPLQSILLQIPSGMASALGVILAVSVGKKTNQALYTGIFMLVLALIGVIIMMAIPSGGVRLLGYYISWAGTGAYSILITTIGNNVSGYTKKIFYNGSVTFVYTIANFCGPLMMMSKEKPRYLGGMGIYAGSFALSIVCFYVIRLTMSRVNKDRLANPPSEPTDVYLDLTDKEDGNFIYRL